jgi:hypothetical protein
MRNPSSNLVRAIIGAIVGAVALGASAITPARAAEDVDLLLVLAADVSRSVDATKFQLQRDGYAAAITDPRVLDAIRSGTHQRIAVAFVEWSGFSSQKLIIDWSIVRDVTSAQNFAAQIVEAQRPFADRTSISAGIEFAMTQLERAPYRCERHTIDVSGDGTNNSGPDLRNTRDAAVAKGVTINGLVILSETPLAWNADHTNPLGGLENYYRDNVIGGVGAFVMVAKNFESFGNAIIGKLIAEIAAAPVQGKVASR